MARSLSISEYGILATLFSILYALSVFSESIQTILTKYTASEKSDGKLKNILRKSLSKSGKISFIFLLIYLILSFPLSYFLKIPYALMMINGGVIFLTFLVPVTRGVMQGKKRFKALGLNMIVESVGKIVISVLLVYLGFKVYGAMIGVLFGISISFLISFCLAFMMPGRVGYLGIVIPD